MNQLPLDKLYSALHIIEGHFTYLNSVMFNDATTNKDLENAYPNSSFGILVKRVVQNQSAPSHEAKGIYGAVVDTNPPIKIGFI